jgi:hypothetical protein
MLFALLVIVVALGFQFKWFEFGKNPETNKTEFKTHPENVTKSMEATKVWFKDVYAKSKDKFTSAKDKLTSSKDADAAKLHKDLDEVTKKIDELEKAGKEVDDDTKKKLKDAEDRLDKFLKEHEGSKAPEKSN